MIYGAVQRVLSNWQPVNRQIWKLRTALRVWREKKPNTKALSSSHFPTVEVIFTEVFEEFSPKFPGLLYNLVGTAQAPIAEKNHVRVAPCKTLLTEMLTVSNWLQQPQRFKVCLIVVRVVVRENSVKFQVNIDMGENPDSSATLKGLDYIDVPALGERQYKANFYSFKECKFLQNFSVDFIGTHLDSFWCGRAARMFVRTATCTKAVAA